MSSSRSAVAWWLAMGCDLLGAGVALVIFNLCSLMFAEVVPGFWTGRYRSWHQHGLFIGFNAIALGIGTLLYSLGE